MDVMFNKSTVFIIIQGIMLISLCTSYESITFVPRTLTFVHKTLPLYPQLIHDM